MNHTIRTVIVAPMITRGRQYPTRVSCEFQGKEGQIVLDQIRTVDSVRLVKKLGEVHTETQKRVLQVLGELFSK